MSFFHPCARAFFVLAAAASPAMAHPHMFVDAHAELVVDADGRLVGLRVHLLIDELTTLFVLDDNGIEPFYEPLTAEQSDVIGAGIVDGLSYYGYFTDLRVGDDRLSFTNASVGDARLEGYQLAATLELTLEGPQEVAGRSVALSLYDPTYFAAVETTTAPILPAELEACRTQLVNFQPTMLDSVTLAELDALSREETPANANIGAELADRGYVTCAE